MWTGFATLCRTVSRALLCHTVSGRGAPSRRREISASGGPGASLGGPVVREGACRGRGAQAAEEEAAEVPALRAGCSALLDRLGGWLNMVRTLIKMLGLLDFEISDSTALRVFQQPLVSYARPRVETLAVPLLSLLDRTAKALVVGKHIGGALVHQAATRSRYTETLSRPYATCAQDCR